MAAAALVILVIVMSAAALVVIAVMVAALMSFPMMVTISAGVNQIAPQKRLYCLVGVSGSACADFDPRILKRVQRSAAKTAADQHLNVVSRKKSRQRAVADPVRADHFTRHDLSILYLIYFKTLCSSEMLENVSVIIGYCNLHHIPFCYAVKKVRLTIVAQDHIEKKSKNRSSIPYCRVLADCHIYFSK